MSKTMDINGIGRTTVETFVREHAALVVAIDTNAEKLQELSSLPAVSTKVLDVRDGEAIRKLADELDAIDVLFNCAGYVHHGNILDATEDEWDFSFDVNVKSMYHFINAFMPKMITKGKGNIINMASVIGTFKGNENRCVYGATKAAVIGLTRGVARDFVRQGIRCNVICPSSVDTPSFAERIKLSDKKSTSDNSKTIRPLAEPQEVANLCLYLASDESTYHTGNVFTIDGGFTL